MAEATETQTTYTEFAEQVGKNIVEQIERAQETQVEVVSRFRDAISQWLPSTSFDAPWLENLPSPRGIAEANFKLAQTVLEAQRRYALGLLDSLTPTEEAPEAPAPLAAAPVADA